MATKVVSAGWMRQLRSHWVAIAACASIALASLLGCSDDSSDADAATPAERVVVRYLDLVRTGSAEAIDLRCDEDMPSGAADTVLELGRRILSKQGSVQSSTEIGSSIGPEERYVAVRFTRAKDQVNIRVIKVGDEWKVCGQTTVESETIRDDMAEHPLQSGPQPPLSSLRNDNIASAVETALGPSWTADSSTPQEITPQDLADGLKKRSLASWVSPQGSNRVIVGVHTFESDGAAALWIVRAGRKLQENAVRRIDVPGEFDRGMRLLSGYNTFTQASSTPPWSDTIFLLYGPVVATVNVGPQDKADDNGLAAAIATSVGRALDP